MTDNKFDVLKFFIEFDLGEMSDEQAIAGFQWLLDHDYLNALQGSYGRAAQRLLANGHIIHRNTITKEDNDG